ncbi:MAG TPA: RNA-binding protein [Chitinophagaceae bacterium]|nr:RNA-binding protein [Chitinophagaceae bacterium]
MYVSNLGFQTSDDDLRKLFETFGQVDSAKVITDRETGRSRGFGFVEMSSNTEANQAMGNLNGKEILGRAISVSVAREKENRQDKKRW